MSSKLFSSVLLEISNQLSPKELEDLKFLCRDLGKKILEDITSGTGLFQVLTERSQLGADNIDYLSGLLLDINRLDLSNKLNDYSQSGFTDNNQPDQEERDKLDIATDVIAGRLGTRDWRKLGRKLGLNDVKLESISKRHPTEQEETTRAMLKEWRKSREAEARTEELIEALRACNLNETADRVVEKLPPP
ncbi:FAS-associated death domain protein-like [Sebastes umbrosus]|uniref:FAS-associated death domain protein-like n=1 Tax=Sebastes umbrosus TaxID=72105 RepID=UPI00189E98A5|nr:FAS-associated death domain protein-like [Sebastes umbrosus]